MTLTPTNVTAPTPDATTITHLTSSDPGQPTVVMAAAGTPHSLYQARQNLTESAANVDDFALDLDRFVRSELPRINSAIEAGTATVADLMTATRVLVRAQQHAIPRAYEDRQLAAEITRQLGFIAASIERHAQAVKAPPGDGLLSVSGFTEVLCAWAGAAGLSPMLDYDGYWLRNRHAPLTFTGEREELVFNELVNRTVDVAASIMRLLNDLRTGVVAFDNPGTVTELNIQALKLISLYEAYRDLGRKNDAGTMIFSPAFFMRMRQYLLSFPIAGVVHDGPNATFSPNQARIDVAFGISTRDYQGTLATRLPKMTPAHRELMVTEMALPSIADAVVAILDLPSDWPKMAPAEIFSQARERGATFVETMTALKRLLAAQIQLSNVHFGRISTHLTKPSAALTPAQADAMPVKPTGGVGGNDVAHTREIVDMRKTHPVVSVLFAAF
ncbi:MAG: hypothetical protein JHD07_01990 [Bradyrhizobium sp.]|uniref:hypothetical protein n=1 Tax=Bradyrhizobium sp. TaxID=376 RepID=UPI001A2D5FF9|nr:hypothetical protein [Bradyrhizobium sp.]MBJ7402126.1 hypothetical protein [Bradyrhizobium sp.]